MQTNDEINQFIFEYAVIGGGPAALAAIPQILNSGVAAQDIIWIDPQFKVGDFGSMLSMGSSVPGNTTVESYQKVYHAIYKMIPACAPINDTTFEIDTLPLPVVPALKIAAQPFQHISNELRKIVCSVEGKVTDIFSMPEHLTAEIQCNDGKTQKIFARRVILATGAQAKTLALPISQSHITMIDPNIVFIQSRLSHYLNQFPEITSVAVIGSSHSAALATMHLLKVGISVKQFMNKAYKYATSEISDNGTRYTKFDNTGLKGDVAKFTKQLFADLDAGIGEYKNKLKVFIGESREEVALLLEKHLTGCSHAIAAIGYEPSASLRINGHALTHFKYDAKTTEIIGVPGMFGIGVAFPEQITAISGEVEYAVGVGKFWTTVSKKEIKDIWEKNAVGKKQTAKMLSHFFIASDAKETLSSSLLIKSKNGETKNIEYKLLNKQCV